MQKPREKGDYGITPTDAEKRRLAGQEPGPGTPAPDKKEEAGEGEAATADAGNTPAAQPDAATRTNTPYQEGGLG